jgi:hypothetical protein
MSPVNIKKMKEAQSRQQSIKIRVSIFRDITTLIEGRFDWAVEIEEQLGK